MIWTKSNIKIFFDLVYCYQYFKNIAGITTGALQTINMMTFFD